MGRGVVVLLSLALMLGSQVLAAASHANEALGTGAPWIHSDKDDYLPGSLVSLDGGNWQPGETVHIYVNDDEGRTWERSSDVVAGPDGSVADSFNLPEWFVATYKVTATGPLSGTATTSFTDGNIKLFVDPAGVATISHTTYKDSTTCTGTVDKTGTSTGGGQTLGVGNTE